LSINVLILA